VFPCLGTFGHGAGRSVHPLHAYVRKSVDAGSKPTWFDGADGQSPARGPFAPSSYESSTGPHSTAVKLGEAIVRSYLAAQSDLSGVLRDWPVSKIPTTISVE
jgi:hypothetical protein